jgi:hypothetical protein
MGEVSGRIPAYNVTLLVSEPEPSVQGADAAGRRAGSNGALDTVAETGTFLPITFAARRQDSGGDTINYGQ